MASAATRALALDPRSATAHTVLAAAYQDEWQWANAEMQYRRAIELDGSEADALGGLGTLLMWRGRTEEGIALARRARELQPRSVERTIMFAWLLYHARRYDDAIRELRTVLATAPDDRGALWFLGFALIDSGQPDEAVVTLERVAVLRQRHPAALGLLARAYAAAGRRPAALAVVDELKYRERDAYVPPAPFVHAYIGLGDRENAFAALERAFRERSHITHMVRTHPLYDPLRDDHRFHELVRRVGL
jgi:Flp pilus assembly protein TadD